MHKIKSDQTINLTENNLKISVCDKVSRDAYISECPISLKSTLW